MNYPKEARVLALERKQARIDAFLRTLRGQTMAVRQQVWDMQSEAAQLGAAAPPPTGFTTTFRLLVRGCLNAPIAGLSMTSTGPGGTQTLVTDASGFVTFGGTPGDVYTVTPAFSYGGWTNAPMNTVSLPATGTPTYSCGPNIGGNTMILGISSGYTVTGFCNYPISTSPLTLADSLYGNCTLTFAGAGGVSGGSWNGCHAGITYPGFGTCAARTMAIQYGLTHTGQLSMAWAVFGQCPNTSTCATSVPPPQTNTTYTVVNCPETTGSFQATYPSSGFASTTLLSNLLQGGTATYTIS